MKSEGAPNWRRLAGFPIYATGGHIFKIYLYITKILFPPKGLDSVISED
jgi:hypothetical protein